MAQNQLLPLRMGTRQRIRKIGTRAWSAGETITFELPRVGLLAGIFATVDLEADSGATVTNNIRAPWSSVNRFTLSTNQGSASLIDISGYGAHLTQRTRRYGSDYTDDSALYAAHSGSGAQTDVPIKASWLLPVSANNGEQFELGLINLQAPEIQVTLSVRCGSLTDLGATFTAVDGTISIYYMYYEIPDPSRFMMPPLAVVRWLEDSQPISATGENVYTVPRQGTLLNMIHTLELNSVFSDAYDYIALRFNKTDEPYRIENWAQRILDRDRYGRYTTGAIFWDFFDSFDRVNQSDLRDAIDTEELSTTESVVAVTAGSTLGSIARLGTIRRFVQILE